MHGRDAKLLRDLNATWKTHQSTAQIAVMKLCTNEVEIFLHFHTFLLVDSGMWSLPIPAFASLNRATELPVVKITELSSMAEMLVDVAWGMIKQATTVHGRWERREGGGSQTQIHGQADGRRREISWRPGAEEITFTCRLLPTIHWSVGI